MKKQMSVADFWAYREEQPNGCWYWTRCRHDHGYGLVQWSGRTQGAHRVAWQLTFGEIPRGIQVCHRCDNPPCFNPAHLFLGTAKDNVQDAIQKGRYYQHRTAGISNPRVFDHDAIRSLRADGLKLREIAERVGCSPGLVCSVLYSDSSRHNATTLKDSNHGA